MSKKNIVVIGGGVAGKGVIDHLAKKHVEANLILIEPHEYFEVPFAQLRALTDPDGFGRMTRKPIADLLPRAKHVLDKAVRITGKSVVTAGGEDVPYDFLVLATGSSFRKWPFLNGDEVSMTAREEAMRAEGKRLAEAESVLIIGGGPVGVELAGEVAAKWPEKEVTIVQGADRILGRLSRKMTSRAQRILGEMGVKIIEGIKLAESNKGWVDTKGLVYKADMVIPAVGIDRNTAWLQGSETVGLDDRGAVKVGADLRIDGSQNIFALGDINDVPETKMGAFAGIQAKVTAKNIMKLVREPSALLQAYKPGKALGIVTLGPNHGAAQLPFGHLHAIHKIKQRDIFCGRYLK